MSSFFTIPGAQKKRKRPAAPEPPKKKFAGPKLNGKPPSKRVSAAPPRGAKKQTKTASSDDNDDSSISGSDLESESSSVATDAESEEEEKEEKEQETAADTRRRLAERYLENVRDQVIQDDTAFDAADLDRDLIAERLQEDVAETKGKVYRHIAEELDMENASHCLFKSGDAMPVTAIAACPPFVYTTTKDIYLQKWRIQDLPQNQWPQATKKKPRKPRAPPKKKPELVKYRQGLRRRADDKEYKGHVGPILCIAVSGDGKFVATGGADKRLIIHDGKTLKALKVFTHHRDSVTGVAFRRGTHQLYSCSTDRTVKVWSLDEMAYVETLFGHQDDIVDIDALAQERCISVGSRDRTARLWKVADETQLVFRGGAVDKKPPPGIHPESLLHEGSMDRVAMIDDELFVTGSDNGQLALWSLNKKKPVSVYSVAHGLNPSLDVSKYSAETDPHPRAVPQPTPRWITALRTVPYSDLIFTGSWEGFVRVWRLSEDKKRIEPVGVLGRNDGKEPEPIKGVVNDIAVFERGEKGVDGICVVAAVGKHHRFGTWDLVRGGGGKNGGVVFEIPRRKKEKDVPNGVSNGVMGDKESGGGEETHK